jgi:hypothetical protein
MNMEEKSNWDNIEKILQGDWDKTAFDDIFNESNIGMSMWLVNEPKK